LLYSWLFSSTLAVMVISPAILIIVSLRQLPADGSDARARRTADNGSFQTAAEDSSQGRSARASDQGSFARTYAAAVVAIVMMMPVLIALVIAVVVPFADLLMHSVVIVAAVVAAVSLRRYGNHGTKQQSRG
jgi:hypothetical protein